MKALATTLVTGLLCCIVWPSMVLAATSPDDPADTIKPSAQSIPFDQIGASVGKNYSGEGLSVAQTHQGADLRCDFQKIKGLVTETGLTVTSMTDSRGDESFRIVASGLGRSGGQESPLLPSGKVVVKPGLVRFIRSQVSEEFSVSVDGLRQYFIVEAPPCGEGSLVLTVNVHGALTSSERYGIRLETPLTGRVLAYGKLKVTDSLGKILNARIEAAGSTKIRITADDAGAVYPVRIDPTFSDEDWYPLRTRLYGVVYALAVSGSDLYVGGTFTKSGTTDLNRIARWDGNRWHALGTGMNGTVRCLAISGSQVYAGGDFTTAGGVTASCVAKWDGSNWSGLGSGLTLAANGGANSLALFQGDLYVGGYFGTAGGMTANGVARWNGTSWSDLDHGITVGSHVESIAVYNSELYVGGTFQSLGYENPVQCDSLAKWNGSQWAPVQTGYN